MKVVLFADGKAGEIKALPGERPLAEIGELLGGAVEWPPQKLTPTLGLCVIMTDTTADQKAKYAYLRQWRGLAEAAGDCAVVRMGADDILRDVNKEDLDRANELVWPLMKGRAET